MSKLLLTLILGSLLFSACRKEAAFAPPALVQKTPCVLQTDNPAGRSYTTTAIIPFTCTDNYCGILPLNTKNFWVYEDSIFTNGVFSHVQLDTLRFTSYFKTTSDSLVWWESNMSVGLPDLMYANDSAFFDMNERLFNPEILDAKKDFGLFQGDSVKYLSSFDDAAAIVRSIKLTDAVVSPAGEYYNCLYFEKNARNYRRDQVYFKPGVGVIKYIYEKSPPGLRSIQLQKISTLVSYQIQ